MNENERIYNDPPAENGAGTPATPETPPPPVTPETPTAPETPAVSTLPVPPAAGMPTPPPMGAPVTPPPLAPAPASAPYYRTDRIPGVADYEGIGKTGHTNEGTPPLDPAAAPSPAEAASPRHEYEVSYDSASGRYTYTYTEAKPAPVPPPKKGGGLKTTLILCLAIVLSLLMGIVGGAIGAASATPSDENTNLNAPVVTETVVKINNAEIGTTSVMQAAAEAVNSVVVIDTFTSQAAANAGEQSGAGSGVIWTADGYIVTCNHVVDGYSIIRVTLADGSTFFADVVGTDSRTDLAVLKIAATGLPAVTARGSELELAETVIAIGNPLGVLSNTVSTGILSCLTRDITVEGQAMSLIQIDAAVNHGNSGGGLFDVNGSLIGIVNAKSTGDSVEGIGFAIPINTVLEVANQLIEVGYVAGRPRLGITVVTVNQSNSSYVFDDEYYPKLKDYATSTYQDIWGREHTQVIAGVYIYDTSLVAGYAEGSEELQFGDRILFVGNVEITANSDVLSALSSYNAGDTIQITVQRNHSTTIVVNLILGQQGAD
ncbi:MAG: trypsin-like peptidase domain-containing protein [Clostridia bacterium]|nr:trypsin-like peptidase domain-containing protein [Clostridia bacterium]